jgi:twitching motility two-component system response regulator PilH
MSNPSRILVIDDQPNLRLLVSKILEIEGYQVSTAANGDEGIALAKSEKPDLILMDVMMPKKNGYQLAAELKLKEATQQIPIVLMTGTSQMVGEGIQLTTPAIDKLAKPFGRDELIQIVKRNLK